MRKILMKDSRHGGVSLGLLVKGTEYSVPDALANDLVMSGAASWVGVPPSQWTDGGAPVQSVQGANGTGTRGFLIIKTDESPMALLRTLEPSGDLTGAGDRDAGTEAMLSAGVAGGGRIDMQPGQYVRSSIDANDYGVEIKSGTRVQGLGGRGAAKIKIKPGSKCNAWYANGATDFSLDGMGYDGSRSDPDSPPTGGSQDAWRNFLRAVNAKRFQVTNNDIAEAAYHGIIMTNGCREVDVVGNVFRDIGFRAVHAHDEGGFLPGRVNVSANRVIGSGAGVFPGIKITAQVQGGALGKLRVLPADMAKLAQIYAAGITSLLIAIPTAGTGGATRLTAATLSAGNPDVSLDLTITIPAKQATGAVVCHILAEQTSGIFVALGCDDISVCDNECYADMAMSIHVAGSPTAATDRIRVKRNHVVGSGLGMQLGSNDANVTTNVVAEGNDIYNSVFEGVRLGNVVNLQMRGGLITDSGAAGVLLVTVGASMDEMYIDTTIRNSGGPGFLGRGSGSLRSALIKSNIHYSGLNPDFAAISEPNIYNGAGYNQGFGMAVLVLPDAANKYASVIVNSDAMRCNAGGAVHINGADHKNVQVRSAIDNVPAAGGTNVAFRLDVGIISLHGSSALALARACTGYAFSIGGATSATGAALMDSNRTNYSGAQVAYFQGDATCKARDNILPAGKTVQFAGAAGNSSDAELQRVA